jgi:hypothetical protein
MPPPNGARDERHPDSQAWPRRGDAETKGRSAAESERSEDVRSIERRPEAGARHERTLEAVGSSARLGMAHWKGYRNDSSNPAT